MKDQARFLRPGDYLPATKSTVLQVTHSGIGIPSGKVEIVVKSDTTGKTRRAQWGARTEITYERKTEA